MLLDLCKNRSVSIDTCRYRYKYYLFTAFYYILFDLQVQSLYESPLHYRMFTACAVFVVWLLCFITAFYKNFIHNVHDLNQKQNACLN